MTKVLYLASEEQKSSESNTVGLDGTLCFATTCCCTTTLHVAAVSYSVSLLSAVYDMRNRGTAERIL